jgi:hypothetical protein
MTDTSGTVARALSVLTVIAEAKARVGVKDVAGALKLDSSKKTKLGVDMASAPNSFASPVWSRRTPLMRFWFSHRWIGSPRRPARPRSIRSIFQRSML